MTEKQLEPRRLSLLEISEGMVAVIDFCVSEDDMMSFAHLSGDHNPLHLSNNHARDAGFEGSVVYGALIIAQVSRLIGMELPGLHSIWNGVSLDFRAPLYVDQDARLTGTVIHTSEATQSVSLALHVEADGQTIAKGKATISLRKPVAGNG
jgi:3-hydroxybutyryl-CoA dehydratase